MQLESKTFNNIISYFQSLDTYIIALIDKVCETKAPCVMATNIYFFLIGFFEIYSFGIINRHLDHSRSLGSIGHRYARFGTIQCLSSQFGTILYHFVPLSTIQYLHNHLVTFGTFRNNSVPSAPFDTILYQLIPFGSTLYLQHHLLPFCTICYHLAPFFKSKIAFFLERTHEPIQSGMYILILPVQGKKQTSSR